MFTNIPIGVIGDKFHTGAPSISGFGNYKQGGYTGPVGGIPKGQTFKYKGFGRGWGFVPSAISNYFSNAGVIRPPTGQENNIPGSIDYSRINATKEVQNNIANIDKVMSSFKTRINSLLQDNVDKAKIDEGLDILNTLKNDPNSYLKTDTTYNTNLNQMTNSLTKELSAQGFNPAESGYGAATLEEKTGRYRNNYISSLQNKILKAISFSGDVQRQVAGLSSIGQYEPGQTDNIPGQADTLKSLFNKKVSAAKNYTNLANANLTAAVSRGK